MPRSVPRRSTARTAVWIARAMPAETSGMFIFPMDWSTAFVIVAME